LFNENYWNDLNFKQLVITYDSAAVKNPPKTYKELREWVKQNPGKFTYPRLPDDFVGSAFVRNAFYELTGAPLFQPACQPYLGFYCL